MSQPKNTTPGVLLLLASAVVLLLFGALAYHFGFPLLDSNQNATTLSAIVIVGLALTVVMMGTLALIYTVMGAANKHQPLGLPEGSVRALLAFSLVLSFVCLSAFLFTQVRDGVCERCKDSSLAEEQGRSQSKLASASSPPEPQPSGTIASAAQVPAKSAAADLAARHGSSFGSPIANHVPSGTGYKLVCNTEAGAPTDVTASKSLSDSMPVVKVSAETTYPATLSFTASAQGAQPNAAVVTGTTPAQPALGTTATWAAALSKTQSQDVADNPHLNLAPKEEDNWVNPTGTSPAPSFPASVPRYQTTISASSSGGVIKDQTKTSSRSLSKTICTFVVADQVRSSSQGDTESPGLKQEIAQITLSSREKESSDRRKEAIDFAKQIFTTLSGVFISVVSFYFGSSVTSSALGAGVKAISSQHDGKGLHALQDAYDEALRAWDIAREKEKSSDGEDKTKARSDAEVAGLLADKIRASLIKAKEED
ncbi:hypothetical protein [Granulicella sibirica]|uniref:Uncharacterized protein n=1 Tax=Granulicella sibirica TaxID=2479048 RepID=A0A4Q0SZC6_9BACT|nr:hypothetical protein [Granulicella sibirica]RXH55782.1 hypothetical protein GRAN_2639 [Granulicella sibirica]